MKLWSNGKILKDSNKISTANHSLCYGPVVWEGMRAYLHNDGISRIFKLEDHVKRLKDSAKILEIELPYSISQLIQASKDVVEHNKHIEAYLRPVVYALQDFNEKGSRDWGVDIYCVDYSLDSNVKNGVKMLISSHVRSYPQYYMQSKNSMNYTSMQLALTEAKRSGMDDAFMIDSQGYITEATISNFFVVKGDIIMTPPNDGSILPGITRQTIAELLSANIMFVKYKKTPFLTEKKITRADLYTADEIFLCGTYYEIIPVIEVDGRKVGTGSPGMYTNILRNEYSNLVRGK